MSEFHACLITDPIGHRRHEATLLHADSAFEESLGLVSIVIVPDDDEDWCCDFCVAPIDLDAGPILCVRSYALCGVCASKVLAQHPELPRQADGAVLLPVCGCPPCGDVARAAAASGGGALEVIDPRLN